ncbi:MULTISPECIES: hypothetical protein [unclassified Campylobacter]|uniref:hypothetical protein n=1 Tax=unclassified Campylobacter TaxID=2593542 RepID=UPI0022EA0EC1|nr:MULTISPECIES: hypothetical protein [unclassified Campylobacter]MDA3055038.1 hypothetical protein [Campylobacter sp. VBCF_07 NA4]MDA3060540.1 hypothetical protein [Campylobacter sp. VBCF_02 NA5]MDA3070194.1 hypothetical protein [Campylobacter sp. VBCF_08 NA3]
MQSKKFVFIFFGFSFFMIFAFLFVIWYRDPLRLYHKPYSCKNEIWSSMRLSAAGLIKHHDFDSLIFGTSMLENTSAKEANANLGGKFMNLSLSGSDFYERALILDFAFRHKNFKKIIYSLDTIKFLNQDKGQEYYTLSEFNFLYDEDIFNDIKVYFTDEFLKKIFKLGKKYQCQNSDFDRPNAWFKNESDSVRFGGFENWIKNKDHWHIKDNFKDIKNAVSNMKSGENQSLENLQTQILNSKKYIDDYLLKFVKNKPDTEFLVFLPPYSRIHNAIEFHTKKQDFLVTKEVLRYLVEQSQIYKNLKIYAWGDTDYPDNIANYKDLTHYSHKFNSQMLLYLKDGTGLLTPENFDAYYEKFEQKSREFDLMPYYEKIK